MRHDLQMMLKHNVPIIMLTDSLSLFDIIAKSTTPTEKGLAIDLDVVRWAYARQE
jgi:hypothetical protein